LSSKVKPEALPPPDEWLAAVTGGIGKDVRGAVVPDGVLLCVELGWVLLCVELDELLLLHAATISKQSAHTSKAILL
jgi:hypothetical protein